MPHNNYLGYYGPINGRPHVWIMLPRWFGRIITRLSKESA